MLPWEVAQQQTLLKEEVLKLAARGSVPKVDVNTLETKDGYDLWKYQFSGVVSLLGVDKVLKMVKDNSVTAEELPRNVATRQTSMKCR